jgi:hypothetical protein
MCALPNSLCSVTLQRSIPTRSLLFDTVLRPHMTTSTDEVASRVLAERSVRRVRRLIRPKNESSYGDRRFIPWTRRDKRLERSHCVCFVRPVGASDDVFSHSSALQGRARRAPQQRQCSCGYLGARHDPRVSRSFNAACVSHRWSASLSKNRRLAQCGTPTHKVPPVELAETSAHDRERTLLREITGLADHVRDMRLTAAALNDAQITLLTGDLQAKWDEVRALRAPPVSGELPLRGHGGLYA